MTTDSNNTAAADAARQIDDVILSLCAERGPEKTICPTDAAKGVSERNGGDELAWREALMPVRRAAVRLAKAGRLIIYRKGKPVDPEDFRGVYRLGLPHDA